MFMIGSNITAADIIVHLNIAEHFRDLIDFQKMELAHAFRWVDHIQHLPGMQELVEGLGLFVSFPNENAPEPSKAQLKKMAKAAWSKDKKNAKQGPPKEKEEAKKDEQKQEGPKQGQKEQKPKQQKGK